MDPRILVSF